MRRALYPVVAALALLTACDRDVYTLRMEATGAGFDRHVEVVRVNANGTKTLPPTELLEQIGASYGHTGPITKGAFDASFKSATPTDVGGRGSLTRAATSLGTTYVYMERFRGDDDTSGRIERIESAAATGAAVFLGWLDSNLAGEPGWPALQARLASGMLRRDFCNIALIVWLQKNAPHADAPRPESSDDDALLVHIASYLLDHGYITSDQMPLGPSIMDDVGARRLLTSWLARSNGLDETKLPPAFADNDALDASWERYLESPQAVRLLEAWAAAAKIAKPSDGPIGQAYLDELTTIATGSEPSDAGAEDEVHLTLACPIEPITTNGQWSAEEHAITWWFNVEPSTETAYLVPAVAFAAWAEPDENAQTKRFGSVVLSGEPLSTYCAWHARLGNAARVRWDSFLDSLSAQSNPRAALDAYKPTDDPAWASEQNGRKLLLDAIGN